MLKKHLTILFLLFMAVGAFAQSIPSGTARYEALGFNPFIMDAATDINRNPAWSVMYRNYAFGDIGRQNLAEDNEEKSEEFYLLDQYAGVNFGLGKQWNIGAVLNKEEGQVWGGDFKTFYQAYGIGAPIVPFELLVGYMTSNKKLALGIAPYFAQWSKDYTSSDSTTDRKSMILGGTIGVVGKMKAGWWEANVDARLNKFKYEFTTTDTNLSNFTVENNGGFEINANVRGFFLVNKPNKINFVPYVSFGMFNWDPKYTTTPPVTSTTEYKWLSIRGGVGINMPILDDGMLAGGLTGGVTSRKITFTDVGTSAEFKVTDLVLPQINVGGEWKFTDWLTGRMGYARSITREKVEFTSTDTSSSSTTESNETIASNSDHTITLGLGWQFGRFSLDGLVGERFIQAGPNILSGKRNDLYGVISASYNFNK